MQQGVTQDIPYKISVTRTINTGTVNVYVTAAFTVTNPNPVPAAPNVTNSIQINSVQATVSGGSGTDTVVTPTCTGATLMSPGATLSCTITKAAYNGYPVAGTLRVTLTWTDVDGSIGPTPVDATAPALDFSGVTGRFQTALLTDTFDYTSITNLYNGFTGFRREDVFHPVDPNTVVPTAGLLIDADQKDVT